MSGGGGGARPGVQIESAVAAGAAPAAAAAPPATAPERNRPRRVSFTPTQRGAVTTVTPDMQGSRAVARVLAVRCGAVPTVRDMTDAHAACPGRRRSRSSRRSTASPTRSAGCWSISSRRATRPSWWRRPAPRRTPASRCTPPAGPPCRSTGTSASASRPGPGCARRCCGSAPTWSTSPRPPRSGCRPRARPTELGIPSVAIYQTDLIGFAERYAKPGLGAGGIRAMAYLTRKIHTLVDRTLAPSTASLRQLEDLEVPRLALWPRGVDLDAFHPGLRDEGLRRQLAPDGRHPRGVRRPARSREGARAAHLPLRRPPLRAGGRRRGPRGGPAPAADARCPLPRRPARRRARPRVRVPGRVRAHRPARDLLPVRPGGARLRRPGRRPALRRPDRRRARRRGRLPLRARRRRRPRRLRRPARPRPGVPPPDGHRRAAFGRGPLVAGGQRGARRALPRGRRDHDRYRWPHRRVGTSRRRDALAAGELQQFLPTRAASTASSTWSTRWTRSSIGRPRASERSSGQAGSVSVQ